MKLKKVNELFVDSNYNSSQWMFAYGSLTNTKLRHLLLNEVSEVIACKISETIGYKRKWILNKSLDSITSGIFEDLNPTDINGIIFEVQDDDFIKLDDYEYGYKRVEMSWNSIEITNKELYSNSKLWIYLPDQEYIRPDFFKHLPTIYVDYCMEGFKEISEEYMIEFAKTTD